jgi:hypothetical protein
MKRNWFMLTFADKLGAIVTILFYVSAICVFMSRLLGKPGAGHWIGYFEFLLAIPLLYLLFQASQMHRPALYSIQIGCMLAWLLAEALLDYIFHIDFRNVRWMVIAYVMLFFAGTGGLLGIATKAGSAWNVAAITLFLIMAILTFVQRAVTGQ